jgi:hypothetical protein
MLREDFNNDVVVADEGYTEIYYSGNSNQTHGNILLKSSNKTHTDDVVDVVVGFYFDLLYGL